MIFDLVRCGQPRGSSRADRGRRLDEDLPGVVSMNSQPTAESAETATPEQSGVHGVDDGVDFELRDVALPDGDAVDGECQPSCRLF